MKQLILTTMLALLAATAAQAEKRVETVRDTVNNQTKLIELEDRTVNGQTVTDTLSITTYEGADAHSAEVSVTHEAEEDDDRFWGVMDKNVAKVGVLALIPVIAVSGAFILPIAVVFIAFYYKNKKRRAMYQLVEKALAAGQPLPADFFRKIGVKDLRSKGFSNLFLGLGLFIFLWALTEEIGIGCVGLLILCIGLGQLATYYTRDRKRQAPQDDAADANANPTEDGQSNEQWPR